MEVRKEVIPISTLVPTITDDMAVRKEENQENLLKRLNLVRLTNKGKMIRYTLIYIV